MDNYYINNAKMIWRRLKSQGWDSFDIDPDRVLRLLMDFRGDIRSAGYDPQQEPGYELCGITKKEHDDVMSRFTNAAEVQCREAFNQASDAGQDNAQQKASFGRVQTLLRDLGYSPYKGEAVHTEGAVKVLGVTPAAYQEVCKKFSGF